MLLGDRRQALLHFCLVGMEIGWITPFATLLLYQQGLGWSPGLTFCRFLGAVLLWILALELLNRWDVGSPWYALSVALLLVLSTLLLVRFWLHWNTAIGDLSWLRSTFDALFNFHRGVRPELVLVLADLLLWQRATSATSRSLDFFSVGVSFRLGILLLILGGGLLKHVTGQDATSLFWLYLGLGLTVGGVAGLSPAYTPASIRTALGWFGPLWKALGMLLEPVGVVILWLLEVIINGLYWLFSRLLVGHNLEFLDDLRERFAELLSLLPRSEGATLTLPHWLMATLRYGGVLLALLIAVGTILLSLESIRSHHREEEAEEELEEEVTLGAGTLGRGWRWLLDRVGLVRRFGVGRELLAAISVQNMYANLCRLAGQRGYPRHPAQPPDRYLPVLVEAFGGHQRALSRITIAYMRVHYGDRAVSFGELARLRGDYDEVRTSEQEGNVPS